MDSPAIATDTPTVAPVTTTDGLGRPAEPVLEDLLVEDVSIDGMCGVY